MEKVLIGVGGTGAKILEAFTYMTIMGHPRILGTKVHLRLVDYDENNGNNLRLKELLDIFNRTKGDEEDSLSDIFNRFFQSFLPKGALSTVRLIHEVEVINDGKKSEDKRVSEFVWAGNLAKQGKLQQVIEDLQGGKDKHNWLADALYSQEDRQRDNLGFWARPYLGALRYEAELNKLALDEEKFKDVKSFMKTLEESLDSNAVPKIMFAGSIYGGTGASGIPALAKNADEYFKGNALLAMLLMLPHFSYRTPDKKKTDESDAPDSKNFPLNSKLALSYYSSIMDNENNNGVFRRITSYLVGREYGSNHMNPFGKDLSVKGYGPSQVNPPLPAELTAAIAAMEYLSEDSTKQKQGSVYSAGSGKTTNHRLKIGEDFGNNMLSQVIKRMAMFALLWHIIRENKPNMSRGNNFEVYSYLNANEKASLALNWNYEFGIVDEFITRASTWLLDLEANEVELWNTDSGVIDFLHTKEDIEQRLIRERNNSNAGWNEAKIIDIKVSSLLKSVRGNVRGVARWFSRTEAEKYRYRQLLYAVLKTCFENCK